MTHRVYNSVQSYEINVDSKGIIIESSNRPDNKDHWVIGCSLEWLTGYYNLGTILKYRVEEI